MFWRVDGPQRAGVTAELVPAAADDRLLPHTARCRSPQQQLERAGVRAAAIHGGRSQNQRDKALAMFKIGRVEALVATDVAARASTWMALRAWLHYDTPKTARRTCTDPVARRVPARVVSCLVGGHGDTRTVFEDAA